MPPAPPHAPAAHWRVRTVLLWLVLACVLPGSVGTALLFQREYLHSRAQLERDLVARARAMVQSVDSQLFVAQTTAQTLVTSGSLVRRDLAAFHRRARDVVNTTRVGMNFVLSDATGQQLVNTLREWGEPLPRHGNPDVLQRVFATGAPVISDVYLGGVLRKPVLSIDVPVMEQGKVVYCLSIGLLPGDFSNTLAVQSFPHDWVSAIFDSQGTIVARTHSPEKFVGQKGTPEYIQRIKESPEGAMHTVTREGIPTLSVWSRSPVTGWSVGVGIPRVELERELAGNLTVLALGIAILLVIGLGLAWLAGRKISVSVRALTAPAVAMQEEKTMPVPHVTILEAAEVATAIDQTSRLLAARATELREAHRIAGFGTWRWNVLTDEMAVSDSVREICGGKVSSFAEMRGTLLSRETWEQVKAARDEAVRTGVGYDIELQINHPSGCAIWLNQKCEAVRDARGQVCELRGSIQDITPRKKAELELEQARQTYLRQLEQAVAERTASLQTANQELERLNRTDVLTGLQNRHSADERLRQEFLRLKRTGGSYAVLFMDIDHFKTINDTYGHEAGDQVLREMAAVLGHVVRETDFVARYGGEEFLLVLSDTTGDGAMTIAEKIRQATAGRSFGVAGQVTVSVGVAVALGTDKNEEEVVHRADTALYRAKNEGRNAVRSG